MTHAYDNRILTINSGSSSLKIALFLMGKKETMELSARIERIGLSAGHFQIKDGKGQILAEEHPHLPDHDTALNKFLKWLQKRKTRLTAVGHRVVHGGLHYGQPELITPQMEKALAKLEPLDPDHLPHELKAIRTLRRLYPELTQVACFDTAFHRHMPAVAQRYPLPRNLWRDGVRRFGFHGLSYEFLIHEIARVAGAKAAHGRVIIAHLGNGASMAAIRGGKSMDTTMGFTPTGGLMMSTRSGDLDPGVLLYLLREKRLSCSAVSHLVNRRAGLLGVSGISSDLRDLFAQSAKNPHATEAIRTLLLSGEKISQRACGGPGRPRHADLHGGYRRKHAGDSPAHLRAPGVSWHSPGFRPQRAERRDHFPCRESGHHSRDDDQRGTDDRPAHPPSHAPLERNYS
jgi:acetate kinase